VDTRLRFPVHAAHDGEIAVHADSPRHHISVAVYQSPLMTIGRWRCPAENPVFYDSGPTPRALFAFPRESVWIEHEGRDPFVADPNTVTYYNKGQVYTRRKLSQRGDLCEWFSVNPAIIAETLASHEPAAIDRRDSPFTFSHGPSDPESYLRQRMVFNHVCKERNPDRLFVEEAVLSILGDVTALAYQRGGHGLPVRLRRRRDVDVIEAARDVIARRFKDNLSLSEIAREVGSSVFHLARIFKARTGFSLHGYRNQLRLRSALERLREPGVDLIDIALDLGFSSHSHFTETFRRSFGRTPSLVRESL
jgi:AraC family transcriptional regulator